MARLRIARDDEYLPEFATTVVRDREASEDAPVMHPDAENARLEEGSRAGVATYLCGGIGWLHCYLRDGYHWVAMELHDHPPVPDIAKWRDVGETCYRSHTGAAGLAYLTGGETGPTLPLAGPGLYRVRVSSRQGDETGDQVRLQFWMVRNVELPLLFKRNGSESKITDPERRRTLVADIRYCSAWAEPREPDVQELATRLLASASDIEAALPAARRWPEPPEPQAPQVWVPPEQVWVPPEQVTQVRAPQAHATRVDPAASPQPEGTSWVWRTPVRAPAVARPALPVGDPPRAGMVTSGGDLLLWQDGHPSVMASFGPTGVGEAHETAFGTVLTVGHQVLLVRQGGTVDVIGESIGLRSVLVSTDGTAVAAISGHIGRHSRWHLTVVDLVSGRAHPMPFDPLHEISLVRFHRSTVTFDAGDDRREWQWRPGSEPEPTGLTVGEVEPISGARLVPQRDGASLVLRAEKEPTLIRSAMNARLAPGGDRLCGFERAPAPWFVVIDLDEPSEPAALRSWKLPERSDVLWAPDGGPVWEDHDHLLIRVNKVNNHHTWPDENEPAGIRLDTRTGQYERLPLPESCFYRTLFVRPLIQ